MLTINIAGDFFPGRRLASKAVTDPDSLLDISVTNHFSAADFNIINLECPLTKAGEEQRIQKTGPSLKGAPESIEVLKQLNVNLLTLANNHIRDYGSAGVADTLETCNRNKISVVGAGNNLNEAVRTYHTQIKDTKLAVVNFAENEWSAAGKSHSGANPMDITVNTHQIREARKSADIVIVIIHGGHEWFQYPSPEMKKLYRFFATEGASAIVVHHSHCYSGWETYNGVPIFYGVGNFLFDKQTDFQAWHKGLILKLEIEEKKINNWTLYPVIQCLTELNVKLAHQDQKDEILAHIAEINKVIADDDLLEAEFRQFALDRKDFVLSHYSTSYFIDHPYFRSLIRKLRLSRLFLRKNQIRAAYNFSRCESVRETAQVVFDDFLQTGKSK